MVEAASATVCYSTGEEGIVRFWYNGYHFARYSLAPEDAVYNPYAISRTLANQEPDFVPTWMESGCPSVLVNFLKRHALLTKDYDHLERIPDSLMASNSFETLSGTALLFQCGYLTIKDYDAESGYTLTIPDEEVRRDMMKLMAEGIVQRSASDPWFQETLDALCDHEFDNFFENLKVLYADLPYGSTEKAAVHEAAYLRPLYIFLRSRYSSLQVCFERAQAAARPDLVFVEKKSIFIFELKVQREAKNNAAAALAQIKERDYAAALRSHNLPIYGIGLSFDPKTHHLLEGVAEQL